MSLKLNGRTFNSLPLRFRGGAGFEYAETNKASQRNIFAGGGVTDKASGNPAGHLYPSSWLWPQKSGAINSFRVTNGSSIVSATLAGGLNIDSAISGTSTTSASLVALANLATTIPGTSTSDATWSALAIIDGTITGTSTVTGTVIILGALLFNTASSNGSSNVTATISAIGFMAGTVTPFTELSPQSLAAAVWSATTSQNNNSGSMGKELINKLKKSDFLALKD